jgi:hypothetical protein
MNEFLRDCQNGPARGAVLLCLGARASGQSSSTDVVLLRAEGCIAPSYTLLCAIRLSTEPFSTFCQLTCAEALPPLTCPRAFNTSCLFFALALVSLVFAVSLLSCSIVQQWTSSAIVRTRWQRIQPGTLSSLRASAISLKCQVNFSQVLPPAVHVLIFCISFLCLNTHSNLTSKSQQICVSSRVLVLPGSQERTGALEAMFNTVKKKLRDGPHPRAKPPKSKS